MHRPLARKTIRTIEAALLEEKSTAISEIVRIIQELASKAFSISTSELSQLIGRDPTITEKVISAANTMGFNPMGPSISTITEAIHTTGFEKVRNLAISILLVQNASAAANSFEQRESASLAVCSGLLAQQLTERGDESIDPELAFVCASLRNYGKLLLSTFLVDSYREARAISAVSEEDDAFTQVFGLTPLALARHVLNQSNLSKNIFHSLSDLTDDVRERPARATRETLLATADFSTRVCELAFDETVGADAFEGELQSLAGQYSEILPVKTDEIWEAIEFIDNDLQMFSRDLGSGWVNIPAVANIQARVRGEALPPKPVGSRIVAPPPAETRPQSVARMDEREREQFAEERFQAVNATLDEIAEQPEPDIAAAYETVAQVVQEGLGLTHSIVFVPEETDPLAFSPRHGVGDLLKRIRNRPIVSRSNRDIFNICIERKEDILIQDIHAGKIRSVIPEWIETYSDSRSILLLPVTGATRVQAILFGALDDESIALEPNDHRRMKVLRSQLTAIGSPGAVDSPHPPSS